MGRFFIFVSLFLTSVQCYCVSDFNFSNNFSVYNLGKVKFETERLFLVPTTDDDYEELAELLLDHEVTKYLDNKELKFNDKVEALKFVQKMYEDNFSWTIKTKDKKSIGQLNFGVHDGIVTVGYFLGKQFWKQGFAREACIFLCDKIFRCFDVRFLQVAIREENVNSIKLAKVIFDHFKKLYGEQVKVWKFKDLVMNEGLKYTIIYYNCKKLNFLN